MEPLPRGANFKRAKMLWEIGLHIAGDPKEPYTGNRDICIVVGSGSGENYRPWLRMSSGSPILAHAVVRGDLEMAIVNPSGMLTQAYRGTGLFSEPLPVRVVANYPSWDRFACLIHPRTGLTSLSQININGQIYQEEVEPRLLLSYFLRETAGLTGTHVGCVIGECGACSVLVD